VKPICDYPHKSRDEFSTTNWVFPGAEDGRRFLIIAEEKLGTEEMLERPHSTACFSALIPRVLVFHFCFFAHRWEVTSFVWAGPLLRWAGIIAEWAGTAGGGRVEESPCAGTC